MLKLLKKMKTIPSKLKRIPSKLKWIASKRAFYLVVGLVLGIGGCLLVQNL